VVPASEALNSFALERALKHCHNFVMQHRHRSRQECPRQVVSFPSLLSPPPTSAPVDCVARSRFMAVHLGCGLYLRTVILEEFQANIRDSESRREENDSKGRQRSPYYASCDVQWTGRGLHGGPAQDCGEWVAMIDSIEK
jgi:hypothetical protein